MIVVLISGIAFISFKFPLTLVIETCGREESQKGFFLSLPTTVYVTLKTINLFNIKPEIICALKNRKALRSLRVVSHLETGIEESDVLQSNKRKRTNRMVEMLNIL